jgi:uncharacterized protein YxeA
MNKKILIVLVSLLFLLSSCVFKEDKSLYDYKNEYVGNASATSNIINQLDFDKRLSYDHIQLDYNNDRNTLKLFFNSNNATTDKTMKQNLFNNSCYLFALIKNLDEVKIYINESQKYFASKNYIEDKGIFSKSFSDYFDSQEYFYELENEISRLNVTAFIEKDGN